jgi:hypothetical protein
LYREEFAEQAYKLCLMGAVNADLARAFEVTPRTIDNWLRNEPSFNRAVKTGRQFADGDVAHGLYRRATGYTYYNNKVFVSDGEPMVIPYEVHCPPDVRAAVFWLRNRQPARWRDAPKPSENSVERGPPDPLTNADQEVRAPNEDTDDRRNWWPGAEELESPERGASGHSEAGPPDAPKATPTA